MTSILPERAEGVRLARRSEIPQLTALLARSFDDDPYIDWLVRKDERRSAGFELLFELTLDKLSADLNETYTLHDLAGCVVWKRPSELKLPLWRQLALIPAFARVSGAARIGQLLRVFGELEKRHERHAPDPHYYLHVIGVAPERQGQGLGRSLLRPMLARLDSERMPAYLETHKTRTLPFYERLGFRVLEKLELSALPTAWLLRREPLS